MQGDANVAKILSRYEPVEWKYDGLKGKIIPWTLENGGTSHDPSVLAFVVAPNEKVVAMCPGGATYQAKSFSKWMKEQADAYERAHPRTLVPLVRATVADGKSCPEIEKARAEKKPVLIYVGDDSAASGDKKARALAKKLRAFEKKHFGSKTNAAAAKGWGLFRLDLSDEEHRAYAKALGVTAAPAVLVYLPGERTPLDLTKKLKSGSLAYQLKKLGE